MSLKDTHKIKDIIYDDMVEYCNVDGSNMQDFEKVAFTSATKIEDYFIKRRESRVILEKLWEEEFDEEFSNLVQLSDNEKDGFQTLKIKDMREQVKKFIRGLKV